MPNEPIEQKIDSLSDEARKEIHSIFDPAGPIRQRLTQIAKIGLFIYLVMITCAALIEWQMLRNADKVSQKHQAEARAFEEKYQSNAAVLVGLSDARTALDKIEKTNSIEMEKAEKNLEKANAYRNSASYSNWLDDAGLYKLYSH